VPGGGATLTEEELRTEELDAVPELDLTEEDDLVTVEDNPDEDEVSFLVSLLLLKPSVELDDVPCSDTEEEEPSFALSSLLEFVGSPPISCSFTEEELFSPCPGKPPEGSEEDESVPPITGGSICSSFWLLQVIRKNINAANAGSASRTLRFTIRFINTSCW